MKDYYKIANLFVGKIYMNNKLSEELLIIERKQETIKKVSFRNYISKTKYQSEDIYEEIFTNLPLKLKNDTLIKYLDVSYIESMDSITDYLVSNDLNDEIISKYKLLEIYNKINFKQKEKHLQK